MKKIDISAWKRKEHFQHFVKFDDPFLGIVSQIDCTIAYDLAKRQGRSFFAWYLYRSLRAVNEIEEFKTRIQNDEVILYDQIHASTTLGRKDCTFGLSFVEFTPDYFEFENALKQEAKEVRNSTGIRLQENESRLDLIHYSSIPWVQFTGLKHAREFKRGDSVPKITFGKFFQQNGRKIMAVSIYAHHGLADGIHVAAFLEIFQKLMNRE